MFKDRAAVVGIGQTDHGQDPGVDEYALGVRAFIEALADAGIDKSRVDGIIGAKLYGTSGIDAPTFARLVGLNPKVTGGLDYGSGGFVTQYAAFLIAAGVCDVVACVFARNPPGAGIELCGQSVYDANHGFVNAAGPRAMGWTRHMAKYGTTERALGHVAVAQRRYAQGNRHAFLKAPLTMDKYLAQPYLVWPFRELDVATVTAGGCAIIMTRADRARDHPKKPVYMHAVGRRQATRTYENDEHFLLHAQRDVAKQLYARAGFGPDDVDVLGISDACTAVVPQSLENYGFCGEGESESFLEAGSIERDGSIPTNTDGGQLSGGYLIGWLHQLELVRQLRGEAGDSQVRNARVGQYCTTGRFLEDYLATIYVTEEGLT